MPAKLTVLRGKRSGSELPLDGKAVFDLGSSAAAALRFDEPGVAANHCRIFREEKKFTIFDLCGLGVSVNGQRVTRTVLKHGDEISVGQIALRFEDTGGTSTQGLPSPLATASLHCIEGADKGKVWALSLDKNSYTIGRGMEAEIVVLDIKCSRAHCKLERRDDGFYLVDMGSTNGTRINGRKVKPSSTTKLVPGDQLKLGYSVLALRFEGEGVAPLPETTKMAGLPPPPPPMPAKLAPLPGAPAPLPAKPGVKAPPAMPAVGKSAGMPSDSWGALPPKVPPTGRLTPVPAGRTTPAPPAGPVDVDFDFDATPKPAPSKRPPAPTLAAPAATGDPEEAAEASLRTFVFEEQPSFEEAKADRMAKTDSQPPVKARSDPNRTSLHEDPSFESQEKKIQRGAPEPKKKASSAEMKAKPPEENARGAEGGASGKDPALRTFVFDEAPSFDEPAKDAKAPPPKGAPPKVAPKADDKSKTKSTSGVSKAVTADEDAALRTFVFDDAGLDSPMKQEAPPPPPPAKKPAPAPSVSKAPPPPPPAKAEPRKDEKPKITPAVSKNKASDEDAALRTFVFDDAGLGDAPQPRKSAPAVVPAKPPSKEPAKGSLGKSSTTTPAIKKDAKKEDVEDAAVRTFVFGDDAGLDEGAPAPPAKSSATARYDEKDAAKAAVEDAGEASDPALRTFVFDDQFEAPAAPGAPPPKAPPRAKSTTAKYTAPDEDDSSDEALRTFVFDDSPKFNAGEDPTSYRRVNVNVPDSVSLPPKKNAPKTPPKTPPPKTPVVPATPAAPSSNEDRPPEFQTQFGLPEGGSDEKRAGDDDDEGGNFHTMVFDKPPDF